jgi:hypothetical protein
MTSPTVRVPSDDASVVFDHVVRAAFGAAALAVETSLRSLPVPTPAETEGAEAWPRATAQEVVDTAFGLGWLAARLGARSARRTYRVIAPVWALALAPPLVPHRLTLRQLVDTSTRTWGDARPGALRSFTTWSARLAPAATRGAVDVLDVDELLALVMRQVDVDRLSAAVADELDLTPLIDRLIAGVDLTPVVEKIMASLDLDKILADAVGQLDVSDLVATRVDSFASAAMADLRRDGLHADQAITRVRDRFKRHPEVVE